MKNFNKIILLIIGLSSISATSVAVAGGMPFGPRLAADTFAALPIGAGNPEALAVDDDGNVYVSTFQLGVNPNIPVIDDNIFVYDENGVLIRALDIPDGSTSNVLLELAFHPVTGALLVVDFRLASILEVDVETGAATVFATIPPLVDGAQAAPNGLTFDANGNLYITDSFQSTVWKVGIEGGEAIPWITNDLLGTSSPVPFGANGLDFTYDYSAMFVSNSGDGSLIRIPVNADGTAGVAETFLVALNGPDGLIIDEDDNIWITTNPSNEILIVDPTGRATQVLGEFLGLDDLGRVIGLLSPSDLNFGDGELFVTNFAANPTELGINQMPYTSWAVQVEQYTVARIDLTPPPVPPAAPAAPAGPPAGAPMPPAGAPTPP